MLKTTYLILVVATLVVAIIFAVTNFDSVRVEFFGSETHTPLSVLLFAVFACGLVLGVALDAWILISQRRKIKNLEKTVEATTVELANLRKMPIKDLD